MNIKIKNRIDKENTKLIQYQSIAIEFQNVELDHILPNNIDSLSGLLINSREKYFNQLTFGTFVSFMNVIKSKSHLYNN